MNPISCIADQAFDAALALVYPQACAVCGGNVESRHDGVACSRCWNDAPLFRCDEMLCWKCGSLSLASAREYKRKTIRCGRCADDAYTAARTCGLYEGALRASILELKRQPHVPRRVAQLMRELQSRTPLNQADLIIAVPLHVARERDRGFNQASVLARELSRLTALPLDENSFVRRLHTERHRAGMDAKARRKSVQNAFTVRDPDLISDKHVLLVDDVLTTGATVSACAAVLNDAGAAKVLVMTLARA